MNKKLILFLPVLFCLTAYTQEVLRVQNGASITLQSGAQMTVAGGITLDNGSSLSNGGSIILKQNGASGTADFVDNTATAYNYGPGGVVFNSAGGHVLSSNNAFCLIDVTA